jgi:hypothetical protein
MGGGWKWLRIYFVYSFETFSSATNKLINGSCLLPNCFIFEIFIQSQSLHLEIHHSKQKLHGLNVKVDFVA